MKQRERVRAIPLFFLFRNYFFLYMSINGVSNSIGKGKMVVELFSEATSVNVWRYLNCSAIGFFWMIAAASPNFTLACNSPSA